MNNDDNELAVQYKLVGEESYRSQVVPPFSNLAIPSWSAEALLWAATIQWLDPDRGTWDSLTSDPKRLEMGLTVTFTFTIPRYSAHTATPTAARTATSTPTATATATATRTPDAVLQQYLPMVLRR